jgi:hypothetical protein
MSSLGGLPGEAQNCIFPCDSSGHPRNRRIDDLIYLKDSSCADEVGLTMTLAHELQHAIQHANERKWWALSSLVSRLLGDSRLHDDLGVVWGDIPIELEARIISKRVAESLFDKERVTNYIDKMLAETKSDNDAADWKVIRGLKPDSTVDFPTMTLELYKRVMPRYSWSLSELLAAEKRNNNPDFADTDLPKTSLSSRASNC